MADQVFGPYASESATYDEPLLAARRALVEKIGLSRDSGQQRRDLQLAHLLDACKTRGVDLGRYDERIVTWLAGYDTAMVQVVIGLISRAYAAGRALGQTEDCANCGVPGPCQPIGCDNGRHLPGCFWAAARGEVPPTDPGDLPRAWPPDDLPGGWFADSPGPMPGTAEGGDGRA